MRQTNVFLRRLTRGMVAEVLLGQSDRQLVEQFLAFSPDGAVLVAGETDGTLRLWDTQTNKLRRALQGHTDWIWDVAFAPDGKTFATGSADRTVRIWDTQTGKERRTLEGNKGRVYGIAYASDSWSGEVACEKAYPRGVGRRLYYGVSEVGGPEMGTGVLVEVLRYVRTLTSTEGSDQSDGELLEQFVQRRDESAFAALLDRHGPLVLSVCHQVLRDEQEAEDAFQAVFLVLSQKAGSIRRGESLAAWLHRVALNVSRTARTGTARRRAHERGALRMARASLAKDEPSEDWKAALNEEVDRLPQKYRLAVILCYFEGKTH